MCDKNAILVCDFLANVQKSYEHLLTCDCRSSMLEPRLSLLTVMAPTAEHPSDTSPRPRLLAVAAAAAATTLIMDDDGDGDESCEVAADDGRLLVLVVAGSVRRPCWL